jgi:shikimate dehydrogenase
MTDRYAVIGNPISQSKSPLIHSMFARATGEDLAYERIEAPYDGFAACVDAFRADGGRGVNVTAPFKVDAYTYATDRLDHAQEAGASNCLSFDGDRVYAENFDGIGLVRDIEHNLGIPLRGRRVLMLGAGGAVRGALRPMLEQHPARLLVVNRNVSKATALAEELASRDGAFAVGGYDDVGAEAFDIVLNATSASLFAEAPPVPPSVFASGALAYDLTYGKGLTPFLRLANDAGAARLADGVGMLVEQAAEAFQWWRGVRPSTAEVIKALTVPLV